MKSLFTHILLQPVPIGQLLKDGWQVPPCPCQHETQREDVSVPLRRQASISCKRLPGQLWFRPYLGFRSILPPIWLHYHALRLCALGPVPASTWLLQRILWLLHPASFKNQMQFTEKACAFAIKMAGCLKPEAGWGWRSGGVWPSICLWWEVLTEQAWVRSVSNAKGNNLQVQTGWVVSLSVGRLGRGVVNAHLERVPSAGWGRGEQRHSLDPLNDSRELMAPKDCHRSVSLFAGGEGGTYYVSSL